jgi:hypothetical protein
MICDQGFEHPDPEPVIVDQAPDLEPVAEAEVRVAEIQAERDVAIAKISARAADEDVVAQIAALMAENEALRAQLAPAEEEQQQAVVVVADPEPEPEPEEIAPPVVEAPEEKPEKKRKNTWWG